MSDPNSSVFAGEWRFRAFDSAVGGRTPWRFRNEIDDLFPITLCGRTCCRIFASPRSFPGLRERQDLVALSDSIASTRRAVSFPQMTGNIAGKSHILPRSIGCPFTGD